MPLQGLCGKKGVASNIPVIEATPFFPHSPAKASPQFSPNSTALAKAASAPLIMS